MEIRTVRRLCVALFALLCALPLIAATEATSILGTPTLLVYPFAVYGSDVSKEAGSRLAVTIAEKIASLGGVAVKPAPPGVERQNYLDAAHHEGVDYYIAGYVTPLGDGVSVVEQLVSTQTGVVVYSNTAQIRSYEDVTGQGDVLREALLRHQTRNLGAYAAQPPPVSAPSPTPASGSGAQANLSRLFGRKQKRANSQASAAPAPAATAVANRTRPVGSVPRAALAASPSPAAAGPTPSPTIVAASVQRGSGYGMLPIGGPAPTDRRSFTVAAIRNVMLAKHQRIAEPAGLSATGSPCSDTSVGTLLGGNLSTRNHTILGQPQTVATLEFLAYDCAGSVVYRKTFARDARGDWKNAVDGVVQRAVAEFLREPPGAPHG